MKAKELLESLNTEFITGVPDSLLKPFTDCVFNEFKGTHIVAANEGNAAALAAGYYISEKNIPVVYLQNSGIGNIINPVCSLLNEKIYGIPVVFIIGHRGEPGIKDEPQHAFQGEITEKMLNCAGLRTFNLSATTKVNELRDFLKDITPDSSESVAIIVKKNALEYNKSIEYTNDYSLSREKAVEKIADYAENDFIISTTGKISRELFEFRENTNKQHSCDFLNVGSMGHCSSIALSVAINNKDKRIWCIDGDGAAIMHMGAMAVIGSYSPNNLIHIVLNNCAHDTVGGVHTCADKIDFCKIAEGCGYKKTICAENENEVESVLTEAKNSNALTFIEIKVKQGARDNLMRPNVSPKENLKSFMKTLNGGEHK